MTDQDFYEVLFRYPIFITMPLDRSSFYGDGGFIDDFASLVVLRRDIFMSVGTVEFMASSTISTVTPTLAIEGWVNKTFGGGISRMTGGASQHGKCWGSKCRWSWQGGQGGIK
jgi:hypothetical protein